MKKETRKELKNKSSKKSSNTRFTKSKWLKLGSIVLCFCLMVVATIFAINKFAPKRDEAEYAYIVTYAGWSDEQSLYENALNYDSVQDENGHLPIYKIDTFEELGNFKNTYKNILTLNKGYDTTLSFSEGMSKAQYDREIFYEENSLLLVYVPTNGASLRVAIEEIKTTNKSMCIYVEQNNVETTLTDDKTGWFICVQVEKDKISNFKSFDAVLAEK